MITTTETVPGVTMIPLEQIRADQNVRQHLDPGEVDALAQSIALLGQLTPASVRRDGENAYVLIAGHRRHAALKQLGHAEIRVEIRDGSADEAERAAENLVRSALNPYEEALAVAAMLGRGLSENGAAQALGWPKARITARKKLLELPDTAQQMIGAGRIPLSSVDQLRAIGTVSPPLLDALIAFLADGNEWAAERLSSQPGWVLDSAMRARGTNVFAEHLTVLNPQVARELKLGKKAEQLLEEAAELHKKVDRYSYGAPAMRFTEQDIDQARAAGVVIEFDQSAPIIVDRALYRELAKAAIKRTVTELQEKAAAREAERKANRGSTSRGQAEDPAQVARLDEQRAVRELSEQAHGVNLDLGSALMNGLANVDPADMTVARLMVYGLLGSDYDSSPPTQTGERVTRLAASGIRLVVDEFRTDVTKTKKDGTRGKLRIDYGDARDPKDPIAWMWRFIDAAKTASDLYGRCVVVLAAEQYASRLVIPTSQRHPATRWGSHKDYAEKALKKLAGPHLPASLKQLERAVERAHKDVAEASSAPAKVNPNTATDVDVDVADAGTAVGDENDFADDELDELGSDDEDLADIAGAIGADGAVYSDADPGL